MHVSSMATTPAVTCPPTDTLRAVATLMAGRGVGCVVVTCDGAVDGIVTDRDIVRRGVARGFADDAAVEQVMTRTVATVLANADVHDAATTMVRRGVRHLPVVDTLGRLHGMVTFDDLARHLGREVYELTDLLVAEPPTHG